MCWGRSRAVLCAILLLEDYDWRNFSTSKHVFILDSSLTFLFLETDEFATGCSILISGFSVS